MTVGGKFCRIVMISDVSVALLHFNPSHRLVTVYDYVIIILVTGLILDVDILVSVYRYLIVIHRLLSCDEIIIMYHHLRLGCDSLLLGYWELNVEV